MPTIKENGFYTVLVEFEVSPKYQIQLITELANQLETELIKFPGFISASFHATNDGTRIINYAQWKSKEDYENFLKRDSDSLQGAFEKYQARLLRLDHPLIVTRVVEFPEN